MDNGAAAHQVTVEHANQIYNVTLDDTIYCIATDWCIGEALFKANMNGRTICLQVDETGRFLHLFHRGAKKEALVVSPRMAELNCHMLTKEPPDMSKYLLSPMPGLLVKLTVKVGDIVKIGQELAVVEAMKMENSLYAISEGVVKKTSANVGDILAVGQLIIEFK
jgi:propionyl-CoA carboxylase alpha chain